MSGRLLSGLSGWRGITVWTGALVALLSSIFAGALFVSAMGANDIEARVFVDLAGDQLLDGVVGDGQNPAAAGVTVRLWVDDGPSIGQPDAGDAVVGVFTTDASGVILAPSLSPSRQYWVAVDSTTVSAPSGISGATPVAEQTYGPVGSVTDLAGTIATANGPLYGGRDPLSDDVRADQAAFAQSIALANPGDPALDFGFSFNVVTNTEPNAVQGSLRQFVANANTIVGPNAMRFVPSVPTNDTDGGSNSWWTVGGTGDLVVNDADTDIDGTSFGADGSLLDPNGGTISANAGTPVGSRTATLPLLGRPELQIDARVLATSAGGLIPHRMTVRSVHVGGGSSSSAIQVTGAPASVIADVVVTNVVVGTVDPSTTAPRSGSPAFLVRAADAPGFTLQDSFLTGPTSTFVEFLASPAVRVIGNEMVTAGLDGFNVNSPGMTVQGNRMSGVLDYCIDNFDLNTSIEDNLFIGCGDSVGQSGGIRVGDGSATIRFNQFLANNGPGIVVAGENNSEGRNAGLAVISQNEMTDNAGPAIDLHGPTNNNFVNGDGITLNDGLVTPNAGNQFIDYPVLVDITGSPTPGFVTVTGTACAGCVVEIFESSVGAGDTAASGLAHGEGSRFLGTSTANGAGAFSVDVPTAGLASVTATATDTALGVTSEFAQNRGLEVLSGRVLIDPDGDADLVDALPVGGATVRVYRDVTSDAPGPETPAASDPLLATLTTGADGRWTFPDALTGAFWVTIDSRTIDPPVLNTGSVPSDVWAEQTFGPTGSLRADRLGGTETTSVDGPVVGGARGDGIDDATSLVTAEHLFRIDSATPRLDLDTGFSFNVVSNLLGGDASDFDPAGRSVQGSLRQFIQNANAIDGPNTMRFVPTVPTNTLASPNRWWRQSVSVALPQITDQGTTISGEARRYDLPRAAYDPSGGAFRPASVAGRRDVAIARLDTPELELWGNRATDPGMDGFRVRAADAEIRGIAMIGFQTAISIDAGASGPGAATVVDNVIGFDLATGSDPGASNRNENAVVIDAASSATISHNGLGWSARSMVGVFTGSSVIVEQNHIEEVSLSNVGNDGVVFADGSSGTVNENIFDGMQAYGVDLFRTTAAVSIRDNTFRRYGLAGAEQGAIRVFGTGSQIFDNHFTDGVGAPVLVVGDRLALPDPARPGQQATIRLNSFGTLIDGAAAAAAIDLATAAGLESPDGPTPNDGVDGCGLTPGSGNGGLDYPDLRVEIQGASWVVTGTACPNAQIDVYVGDNSSGHPTVPAVQTAANGAGVVNTTIAISNPTLLAATHSTAIQTDGTGSTSEFAPVVPIDTDVPPTITNPGPQSATEFVPFTLAVVGSDPDSTEVWSVVGPPGLTIDSSTGVISWTPAETDGGTTPAVTVRLTGGPVTVEETFTITVAEDTPAPTITAPPPQTITVGQTATLPFTATDATGFSVIAGPAGTAVDGFGVATWTATAAEAGTSQTITVQAIGPGGSASASVIVTVASVNGPPTVDPVADVSVEVGGDITVQISATDPDGPLSYVVLAGPAGLTVNSLGVVDWTNASPVGPQTVTVRVSDSGSPALSSDVSFTVRVIPPPTTTPPTTTPPVTAGPTTTLTTAPTTGSTTLESTSTTEASTTTTALPSTSSTSVPVATTAPNPPSTTPPTLEPLPIDETAINVPVPQFDLPDNGSAEPTLSVVNGIPSLLQAPGAIAIPPATVGLAGAWIFVLGVPLVLWERKRAVSRVAGVDAGETLPAYATRNSTYPFSFLRADAPMLWSRYRFMGLGEGLRVKIESPVGPVWVERKHLRPLHEPIEDRERRWYGD